MQDQLHLMSGVGRVRLERFQTAVILSSVNHTHSKMQMERKTHCLQIHTHAYGLLVFFSVRCEGRSVLRLGDSTVDTLCEMKPPSTAQTTTTKAPLQSSPKPTHPIEPRNLRGEIQEMQPMNTTTLSLAPSSRVTSSTAGSQDVMIYCIGKYEAMLLEFSLQPI